MPVTDAISDGEIRELAKLARLPADADLHTFGESVRAAVQQYKTAKIPNEVRQEIIALWRVTSRVAKGQTRKSEELLKRFKTLSTEARWLLNIRIKRGVPIPSYEELAAPDTMVRAAGVLQSLIQDGGRCGEGRKRPGGKRSRVFDPMIWMPVVNKGWPARHKETALMQALGIAYLEAKSELPPYTVDSRTPGPWGQFVQAVLAMASSSANAVELANKWGAERQKRPVPNKKKYAARKAKA